MLTHPHGKERQSATSYLGTVRQEVPGCVDYYPGWVDDADRLFGVLEEEIAWEQHVLTLYGRTAPTPRLTAWIGEDAYRYSGIVNEPNPWPEALASLRERLRQELGVDYWRLDSGFPTLTIVSRLALVVSA
jgi:alkylated DNA repair dioxygenase AlkB